MGKPHKVKVKPATLVHGRRIILQGGYVFAVEHQYAEHLDVLEKRANAYPKLVALIRFLHEQTYTDAEGPELRAQNERTHKMTGEALRELGEDN